MVHAKGAYLYLDGANFNAFVGKVRPADMGVDVMHMNLHKTFSTPHGGGGPGAGPVGVGAALVPFLPAPTVERAGDGSFLLDYDRPDSIGKMRTFYGNFGVLVRALTYILSYGNSIHEVAENAVLNANYLRKRLEPFYHLKYDAPSYHEVVFADQRQAANGRPQHRHRQAAHGLRLPPADDVVSAHRARRAHDRADRVRAEGGARRVRGRDDRDREGVRDVSRARHVRAAHDARDGGSTRRAPRARPRSREISLRSCGRPSR